MTKWTESDVGNQTGRTVLVTGANSGIGWDTTRVLATGSTTAALAAHPGGSKTNLGNENPGGFFNTLLVKSRPLIERFLLQSSAMGALPTLRAAVDPEAHGGEYYGPDGIAEQMGHPVRVNSSRRSHDPETARSLWQVSEDLTGVKYDFTAR